MTIILANQHKPTSTTQFISSSSTTQESAQKKTTEQQTSEQQTTEQQTFSTLGPSSTIAEAETEAVTTIIENQPTTVTVGETTQT